jgi:hypothetical protein
VPRIACASRSDSLTSSDSISGVLIDT